MEIESKKRKDSLLINIQIKDKAISKIKDELEKFHQLKLFIKGGSENSEIIIDNEKKDSLSYSSQNSKFDT